MFRVIVLFVGRFSPRSFELAFHPHLSKNKSFIYLLRFEMGPGKYHIGPVGDVSQ